MLHSLRVPVVMCYICYAWHLLHVTLCMGFQLRLLCYTVLITLITCYTCYLLQLLHKQSYINLICKSDMNLVKRKKKSSPLSLTLGGSNGYQVRATSFFSASAYEEVLSIATRSFQPCCTVSVLIPAELARGHKQRICYRTLYY